MRADRILLAHGSGGTMMRELIEECIVPDFDDDALKRLDDAASLDIPTGRIAFSTDTYVVNPIFFPGGDIGRLAICGTVNDVATSGATPLYLSVGFVLEEGFPVEDLVAAFVGSATSWPPSPDQLIRYCGCLGDLAAAGTLPFAVSEVEDRLREAAGRGYPAVRHSDAYRAAYQPAYRVVDRTLCAGWLPTAGR